MVAWLSISCQALSNCHSPELSRNRTSAKLMVSFAAAWIPTEHNMFTRRRMNTYRAYKFIKFNTLISTFLTFSLQIASSWPIQEFYRTISLIAHLPKKREYLQSTMWLHTTVQELNHCPEGLKLVLRIRIGFNADPDPDLCPDSDPNPGIWWLKKSTIPVPVVRLKLFTNIFLSKNCWHSCLFL